MCKIQGKEFKRKSIFWKNRNKQSKLNNPIRIVGIQALKILRCYNVNQSHRKCYTAKLNQKNNNNLYNILNNNNSNKMKNKLVLKVHLAKIKKRKMTMEI
jgi:hypothetical protein